MGAVAKERACASSRGDSSAAGADALPYGNIGPELLGFLIFRKNLKIEGFV